MVNDDRWLDNFHKEFIGQELRDSVISGENDQMIEDFQNEFDQFNYIHNDPENEFSELFKADTRTL